MSSSVKPRIKSLPATQVQSQQIQIQYKNYQDFINKHKKQPDDPKENITNTRIAKGKEIYGGSYIIPKNEYDLFLDLYYRDIVSKNLDEYLTEKQLITNGPIVLDFDFRYNFEIKEKQYTYQHIENIIILYLDELKKIFQVIDETVIPIYIFEKPNVNCIPEKNITKDGIHIIIGLQTDKTTQTILRKRIIERIDEVWEDIPTTNTWEEVLDAGITGGQVNWQLYGSKKPDNEKYKLTYYIECEYDGTDGEWSLRERKFNMERDFKKLSVRYSEHLELYYRAEFIEIHEKTGGNLKKNEKSLIQMNTNTNFTPIHFTEIKTKEDLKRAVDNFLEELTPSDYELREAYDYTTILPSAYYGEGSFSKWIRVGWALANTSQKLLIVWIYFSAKWEGFQYSTIQELVQKWKTFYTQSDKKYTLRSIIYWAKQDAPEYYEGVRLNSFHYHLENIIKSPTFNSKMKKSNGCGDSDIAFLLKQMYKEQYICASIKNEKWFRFEEHRWVEDECGTTLRSHISNEMCIIFRKKRDVLTKEIIDIMEQSDDGVEEIKKEKDKKIANIEVKLNRIMDIIDKCRNANGKNHIMVEAKELFYDTKLKFLDLLDSDPYLLCFNNGVWDFREKVFRAGKAEDFVSKSTNIDFIKIKTHQTTVDEINDFMCKLFPIEEIRRYMWEHLASTLIGVNQNQTFNMYIGGGENGKSVLTDLMSQILGDYKSDAPLSLITQSRQKQGQASPDIVALKGIRYAVMQEPSKGDKINDGAMKELTSGTEPIRGRNLFSSPITFIPQFKLIVCANNFMKINTQDHGTWRRIRVVDFVSLFTDNPESDNPEKPHQFKIDRKLKERFTDWKCVFMALLVEKVLETEGRVTDCPKVLESSNKYREREDHIAEFINEKIIIDKNGKLTKTAITNEFQIWFTATHGKGGPSAKELHEYFDKKLGKYNPNTGGWVGARIRYNNEDTTTIVSDDIEYELEN